MHGDESRKKVKKNLNSRKKIQQRKKTKKKNGRGSEKKSKNIMTMKIERKSLFYNQIPLMAKTNNLSR